MKRHERRGAPGQSQYTIGMIADTHDVDDPAAVVAALARESCDYNVHLGDIGGSPTVMHVVREFKQCLGDAAHLPGEDRRQYEAAVDLGIAPLRAYVETRLRKEPAWLRAAETSASYRAVLEGMSRLANPLLIQGNVDRMQLRAPHIQACFATSPIPLLARPRLIDLGWLGLVLWPSWRPADENERLQMAATADAFAVALSDKERVVVLAHEHFFKGPGSALYVARVARAGLKHLSVPRFDPNPGWPCLMRLLRRLPSGVNGHYVFGHVHDPAPVMIAGAPSLRNRQGPGLRYRLYGLGWRGERSQPSPKGRRSIVMLPVAVNEVAVLRLRLGENEVSWRVHGIG